MLFFIIWFGLVSVGLIENFIHNHRLRHILWRIHVNGTRGKSTTTRLIAAGLRTGGYRAIAKVTGTSPRIILEDGTEQLLKRHGLPNIIEQMKIIALAYKRGANAIVIECMALHPENQWISEHRIIQSNIGVITNVRADHLDIMGPTIADVASALSLTIPRFGDLVTADADFINFFVDRAKTLGTVCHLVNGTEIDEIINEDFSYVSFRENVACAVKVCELMGVNRDVALQGMLTAQPDPGVTLNFKFKCFDKIYTFVNAFAANDPVSTRIIWEHFLATASVPHSPVAVIINHRADRILRFVQFAKYLGEDLRPDYIFVVGEDLKIARWWLKRYSINGSKIFLVRKSSPEELVKLIQFLDTNAVILGVGNIKGVGQQLVDYFLEENKTIS